MLCVLFSRLYDNNLKTMVVLLVYIVKNLTLLLRFEKLICNGLYGQVCAVIDF